MLANNFFVEYNHWIVSVLYCVLQKLFSQRKQQTKKTTAFVPKLAMPSG